MWFIEKPFMIPEGDWKKPLKKLSRRENSNYPQKKRFDQQKDSR